MGAGDDPDDGTLAERLLADLAQVWPPDAEHVTTADLLDRLLELDEAPWRDLHGRPLDARGLARMLRPFGVRPVTVRHGAATPRGYARAALADAWSRYTSATSKTPKHAGPIRPLTWDDTRFGRVSDGRATSKTQADQAKRPQCFGVADVADEGPDADDQDPPPDETSPAAVDRLVAEFDGEIVAEIPHPGDPPSARRVPMDD